MRIIAYADPSDADNTRLIYRSMDESIAIANNNGIVTAVGYGSTDIVILSADGNTEASVRVHVGKVFYIYTIKIPEIIQGIPYYAKLNVAYGKAPFIWKATGMPEGLSIDSATGIISGVASKASPSIISINLFDVTVTDADGFTAEMSYSATVNANRVKIMNIGNILPVAYVGEQYKAVIDAKYGTPPYVFSANNLPQGLHINAETGVITGIPSLTVDNTPVMVTVRQKSGMENWANSMTFLLSVKESDSILKINMSSSDNGSNAKVNADNLINYENKDKEIIVETDRASYNLPVGMIGSKDILDAFGSDTDLKDVEMNITIKEPDEDKIQFVENIKEAGKFSIMVPPVDFNVTLEYNGKKVEIDKFDAYIERRILIPANINPYSISTAIVVESDGKLRHVPTRIEYVNGQYYAVVKSRTNSTYVLIDKQVYFTDIEGHYAQSSILNMAGRLIVNGVSENLFNPDAFITRAEFSAMLSRALGITGRSSSVKFTDVQKDSRYYEYVLAVSSHNLVKGYVNNTFCPLSIITVGQAANALCSAMYLTDNSISVSIEEYEEYTNIYIDKDKISQKTLLSIARLKKVGIYFDYEDTKTHANEHLTRAEAVIMIEQLLKVSGLID